LLKNSWRLRNGWFKKYGTKIAVWQRSEIRCWTVSVYNILGNLVKLFFTVIVLSAYQHSTRKLKNFLASSENYFDGRSKTQLQKGKICGIFEVSSDAGRF